jgi:hypothetical protein
MHGLRVSPPAAWAPTAAQAGVNPDRPRQVSTPIAPLLLYFLVAQSRQRIQRDVAIFALVRQSGVVIVEPSSGPATQRRLTKNRRKSSSSLCRHLHVDRSSLAG